ncbi:MAG: hypothetical protein JXB10_17905 [Pirellulales bacterium]|nr:hypothetical protein [Pirellulales bacterium]
MKYRVDTTLGTPQNRMLFSTIIRNQSFAPGQQEFCRNYFIKYALPLWTERANWKELSKYRSELNNNLKKTGQVRNFLTDLAFPHLKGMVENPRLNPFARYNALLALGDLNDPGATAASPIPLAKTLPVLLAMAENPDAPADLRIAALLGLNRHILLKLPDAAKPKVQGLLLKLLADEVDAESKNVAREWMQWQAAVMLGQLGALGTDNGVVKALIKAAGDAKTPYRTRQAAARSLGQLDYSTGGNPKLEISDLTNAVIQMVTDACQVELKKSPRDEEGLRRRLKTRLDAAADGLFGYTGVTGAKYAGIKALIKDQAQFDDLKKKTFKAMQKDLDDKDLYGRSLEKKIQEYEKQLKDWTPKKPAKKTE